MTVSVPLIFPVTVVIVRLDPEATWAAQGYDSIYEEAKPLQDATLLTDGLVYLPEVKLPCQFEVKTNAELKMVTGGDAPFSRWVFVLHRKDLRSRGLLDSDGTCSLKKGDRIVRVEKGGRVVFTPKQDLYIYRIDPASQGFGVDGYDLELVYTMERSALTDGRG